MQINELFRILLLSISIIISSTQADDKNADLIKLEPEKRITKRAAIFIDRYPIENHYRHTPKVIYRRISNQRYNPIPKYRPYKTKYMSLKPPRSTIKKYMKHIPPKYRTSYNKKRQTHSKPWHGPQMPLSFQSVYEPPKQKKNIHMRFSPDSTGFDIPHYEFSHDTKDSFGEPPLALYNIPLKTTKDHLSYDFSNPSAFDADGFGREYKKQTKFQTDFGLDTIYAFSNKRPANFETEHIDEPSAPNEELNNDPYYSGPYDYKSRELNEETYYEKKRKPYHIDSIIKKPWKTEKSTEEPVNSDDVYVGGQYAEPPARVLHKFITSDAKYSDDINYAKSDDYIDPDVAISATISPYVNYKNSNMAFSPQNLNDAFSIVDK